MKPCPKLRGMFIAIVVAQTKQDQSILLCVGIALMLSCLFTWEHQLNRVSAGLAIVICTVAAAAVSALLFPANEEDAP